MIFIKDLGQKFPKKDSKKKRRYGLYKCPTCLKELEVITESVVSGKSKECRSCATVRRNTKHGGKNTRLYRIYHLMKARCLNKNNRDYINYGGRGIVICREWIEDFVVFRSWALENGYSDKLKIDRRDNDGGYTPDNCRWVEQTIQSRNTRRIRKNNTSGYRGVSWHKLSKSYIVKIRVDGKAKHLGCFDDKRDGAIAYNNYVIENKLEHTLNIIEE